MDPIDKTDPWYEADAFEAGKEAMLWEPDPDDSNAPFSNELPESYSYEEPF